MVRRAVRDLIGAGAILVLILAALWVSGSIDVAQFGVTERLSGPRGYPRALLLAGGYRTGMQDRAFIRQLRAGGFVLLETAQSHRHP